MRKIFLLILPLIFMFATAFSQEAEDIPQTSDRERYFNFGPGLIIYNTRDLAMSHMTYSGAGINILTGLQTRKEVMHSEVDMMVNGGVATTSEGAVAFMFRSDLNFVYQRKLRQLPLDVKWMAGGALKNSFAMRSRSGYSNSAFVYDHMSSLNIATSFYKNISFWGKEIELGWQLTMPVLAFVIRPAYAFAAPEPFYDFQIDPFEGLMKSFEPASFGSLFRIDSRLTAGFILKNGNIVEVGYQWEYYNYDKEPVNELWAAYHIFFLATKFNF